MLTVFRLSVFFILCCAAAASAQQAQLSDPEIVAALIAQSAASYPGNCRCPDDVDRRGRRCGGRSAHARANGYKPICSAEDVTSDMLVKFKVTLSAAR
jgi:hypothetical protein